ncbi:MAG: hypothetical protein RI897_4120 [Verrucomicrobiota bacterium]
MVADADEGILERGEVGGLEFLLSGGQGLDGLGGDVGHAFGDPAACGGENQAGRESGYGEKGGWLAGRHGWRGGGLGEEDEADCHHGGGEGCAEEESAGGDAVGEVLIEDRLAGGVGGIGDDCEAAAGDGAGDDGIFESF